MRSLLGADAEKRRTADLQETVSKKEEEMKRTKYKMKKVSDVLLDDARQAPASRLAESVSAANPAVLKPSSQYR